MVVPEDGCSTMNAEWHNASINFALQNVSTVTNCGAVTEALSGVPAGVESGSTRSRSRAEGPGVRLEARVDSCCGSIRSIIVAP